MRAAAVAAATLPALPQEHRAEHHSGRHDNDAQGKAIADALLAEAMRRGTMDNTTVLCMLLAWSE